MNYIFIKGLLIGKLCFIYVDDFPEDGNSHLRHEDWDLNSLYDKNMSVSANKSRFLGKA